MLHVAHPPIDDGFRSQAGKGFLEDEKPAKRTVLIIDDDEIDQVLIINALKAEDPFLTCVAHRAADPGLEALRELSPDLLVLDLRMALKDGFHILDVIRNDDTLTGFGICVLSTSSSDSDRRRALALGADDYIVKPTTRAEYVDIAKALIDRL